MKKTSLTLAVLMVTNLVIGQTDYDVLPFFSAGDYYHRMENVIQMRDGSVLAGISLLDVENGVFQGVHGWCFLKVSRDGAQVLDTAMIEGHDLPWKSLIVPDSDGDGYLFVTIKDYNQPENYLSICSFDEELDLDMANEIRVPLEDLVSIGYEYYYLDNNDILLYYPAIGPDEEFVLSRYGSDGSLKHREVIPDSVCPINQPFGKIKVWNESPRKYVINGQQTIPIPGGGAAYAYFRYCIVDSLFGIEEIIQYAQYPEYQNIVFNGSKCDDFESLNDSTYIIMTGYSGNYPEVGIQVTKRDKMTHGNLKTVYFPRETSIPYSDQITGMQKSSDGNLYIAYYNDGITVIKLDMDLNVIWQRQCHGSSQNEYGYTPGAFSVSMRALDDGGLAIGGHYHEESSSVFVLILSKDGTSSVEAEAYIRPYMFYPNPAQNVIHFQYSPDIKPKNIELYDLQGRLVRSQSNGLENISLQGLSVGTYTMRVMLEDGKAFSDKIVKE